MERSTYLIITGLRTAGLKEQYDTYTQAVSIKAANLIYIHIYL